MLLIALPSFAQSDQRLCASERALELGAANPYGCRAELVPFRWHDAIRQVEMAAVHVGFVRDSDVISDLEKYLFRLPDGKIIEVDGRPSFPAFSLTAQPESQLFHAPDELLYEYQAFELFAGQLCAVAKLKYPFVGQARECASESYEKHPVAFASGVTTPAAARTQVCAALNAEGGNCTGLRAVELIRSPQGELLYRLDARLRLKETDLNRVLGPELAIEYEERSYHISLDGQVSLQSRNREECTHSLIAQQKKVKSALTVTCEQQ